MTEVIARRRRGVGRGRAASGGRADFAQAALPVIAGVLLTSAHVFYGALVTDVAMIVGLGFCALVAAILLVPRWRDKLGEVNVGAAALFFVATLIVAGLTLTPWLPDPHPVWRYAGVGQPATTIDKSSTIVEMIKLLILACVFVVGAVVGRSTGRVRQALLILTILGAMLAAWSFFGLVTGTIAQTQPGRLEGRFLNPNTAGVVFAALLVLCLGLLIHDGRRMTPDRRLTRLAPLVALSALMFVCVVASASRGAIAALAAGGAFFALITATRGRNPRMALAAVVVAVAGGLAVYFMGDLLIDRFFDLGESAFRRGEVWRAHWRAFEAAPVFGYGLGTSETVNRTLLSASNFQDLWAIRAILNLYLQWFEQAGVAGTALMFLCVAATMFSAVMAVFSPERRSTLLVALVTVNIVLLLHGASDFALETPSVAMTWAYLLGLQVALAARPVEESAGRWQAPAAAALTTVTAVSAILVLVALKSGGVASLGPLRLELAAGYDRRAQSLLNHGPLGSAGRTEVITLSRRALAQHPYDTTAWLQIAAADLQGSGRLGSDGVAALRRSFDLVPIDPQRARLRARIALEGWRDVPPDVRDAVKREISVVAAHPGHWAPFWKDMRAVSEPSGRLAGMLWVQRVKPIPSAR